MPGLSVAGNKQPVKKKTMMKTTAGSVCLCALLIAMAFKADGAATNRYVVEPGTAGVTPAAPCTSWATAGTNLKEVVDAANDNDAGNHVIISNGTYWLTGQIFAGNSTSGMRLTDQGGTPISNVVNCIIYRNQGHALEAFGYNNCKTVMVACCVSPGYESWKNPGGTTNDPLLVSIESNNFRLLSAQSSCYNHGTNLPWMDNAVDLDGHWRIDRPSGVTDIGAYEAP